MYKKVYFTCIVVALLIKATDLFSEVLVAVAFLVA